MAKINCNLGMVYAIFGQKDRALQEIDKARVLFDEIYSSDRQEDQ